MSITILLLLLIILEKQQHNLHISQYFTVQTRPLEFQPTLWKSKNMFWMLKYQSLTCSINMTCVLSPMEIIRYSAL